MVDRVKARFIEGYETDDYAQLAFNATGGAETNYVIGTMAIASDPTLLTFGGKPGMAGNMDTAIDPTTGNARTPLTGFTAHSVLLYATQNCLVRFNEAPRVQHLILAGNFYRYYRKTYRIYVVGAGAAAGTLYIWATG